MIGREQAGGDAPGQIGVEASRPNQIRNECEEDYTKARSEKCDDGNRVIGPPVCSRATSESYDDSREARKRGRHLCESLK